MKLLLQLSTLAAAALLSMVSAAPGQKTCHALSEAHANAVCKEYCGSTGYILGECGSEGICICSNKTTTVKIQHTTSPHASRSSLTSSGTTFKVPSTTTSRRSTAKDASKTRSSASKKHSNSVSTISHTRTNSKRHRSTKTTTTYKTVKTTTTKIITMKASEASALSHQASSKSKKRLTTVYTTVSRHHHDGKRPIRTITARGA